MPRVIANGYDLAIVEESTLPGQYVRDRYVKEIYRVVKGEET